MSAIQIGNLKINSNVFLAPVAGYTDRSFRMIVRDTGFGGMVYSELLHPRGIAKQCNQAIDLIDSDPIEQPLGIQIYGNDVKWLINAAQWAEDHGAAVVDINMGCPAKKVVTSNGGSTLLRDPARTTKLADNIVNAVSIPVTAKLRLGWDQTHITAPKLAQQLEAVGIQLITIHGRTTAMRFKGTVDLDGIKSVVDAVSHIPVIGNGDIKSPEDARSMMNYTGCNGVMIARAAMKNPWLCLATEKYLATGKHIDDPTIVDRINIIRKHFELLCHYRSEAHAIALMRARIAAYSKFMGHIKPIKERIRLMKTADDFYEALLTLESAIDPSWTTVPAEIYAS